MPVFCRTDTGNGQQAIHQCPCQIIAVCTAVSARHTANRANYIDKLVFSDDVRLKIVTAGAISAFLTERGAGCFGRNDPFTQIVAKGRNNNLIALVTAATVLVCVAIFGAGRVEMFRFPVILRFGAGVVDVGCIGAVDKALPLLCRAAVIYIPQAAERILSKTSHTIRDYNTRQVSAVPECCLANTGHTIRNYDTRQTDTSSERRAVNDGYTIRDCNTRQTAAVPKRIPTNVCNTVFYNYGLHRVTVIIPRYFV